jgi:hypothetical protein
MFHLLRIRAQIYSPPQGAVKQTGCATLALSLRELASRRVPMFVVHVGAPDEGHEVLVKGWGYTVRMDLHAFLGVAAQHFLVMRYEPMLYA